jgi:apolipoprotein N-acyltransferase
VSFAVRLLLILASAGLYGLSFPPFGSAALAWVCLVPFLLGLQGASARAALVLSWVSGVVMAWSITDFLPRAVTSYYEQTTVFGAALFVAVVSVMCCPSHMLFAWWYRSPRRPSGALAPLAVAGAWVTAELMRTRVGGNPWGTLAYTQARLPALVQIAEGTGVYGVSFAVVAVNAALAELVRTARSSDRRREAMRGLVVATATVALVLGGGRWRLHARFDGGDGVRVAVVQGNVDLGSQWRPEFYGANLAEYLRLTMRAEREQHPALVVWPENAMTFFVEDERIYRAAIANVLAAAKIELVAGGPSKPAGSETTYFNSTFVMASDGEIVGRYDKQVLVPFAEYFPFASVTFLNRRFGSVRQFTRGAPAVPLDTVAGRAAVVTCNEALFPHIVAARVAAGAEYVINLANDAWLADRKYSERVLDVTALRAVEERRWLVRASASGTSALIDPWGRVVAKAEPFTEAIVAAEIHPRSTTTVYGRVGDLFAVCCAIGVVLGGVRSRRQASRPTSARDGDVGGLGERQT